MFMPRGAPGCCSRQGPSTYQDEACLLDPYFDHIVGRYVLLYMAKLLQPVAPAGTAPAQLG